MTLNVQGHFSLQRQLTMATGSGKKNTETRVSLRSYALWLLTFEYYSVITQEIVLMSFRSSNLSPALSQSTHYFCLQTA